MHYTKATEPERVGSPDTHLLILLGQNGRGFQTRRCRLWVRTWHSTRPIRDGVETRAAAARAATWGLKSMVRLRSALKKLFHLTPEPEVRIHLPPAESRVRTRFLDHGWRRRVRIQRGCAGFQLDRATESGRGPPRSGALCSPETLKPVHHFPAPGPLATEGGGVDGR